jgi:tetratricopeptide (TPR) repeat protein
MVLNNYSVFLYQVGRLDEAMNYIQKSLEFKKDLVDKTPIVFDRSLAASLNNLGILLFEMGDKNGSSQAINEALQIRRKLVDDFDLYHADLASSLHNLGITLKEEGNLTKSKKAFAEALKIRKKLLKKAPDIYQEYKNLTLDILIKAATWSVNKEPIYKFW